MVNSIQTKNTSHKKLIIALAIVAGLGLTGMFSYFWLKQATVNYAQEVVHPIEAEIYQSGGIKLCSNGDDGRGSDNARPWYQAFFDVPLNIKDTEALAYRISSAEGYKLVHASTTNKGPFAFTVADKYIGKWYYDYSGKKSEYKNLKAGDVELAFIVDDYNSTYRCSKAVLSNHSVIGIDVRLPEFK